jgi:hypothetical protein
MATSKSNSVSQTAKSIAQTKRQYRTASQWREILKAYQQSDLTQSEFCAQQGISISNFHVWQRKMNHSEQPVDSFIEIQPPMLTAVVSHWDVELELGQGRFLRVRVG